MLLPAKDPRQVVEGLPCIALILTGRILSYHDIKAAGYLLVDKLVQIVPYNSYAQAVLENDFLIACHNSVGRKIPCHFFQIIHWLRFLFSELQIRYSLRTLLISEA